MLWSDGAERESECLADLAYRSLQKKDEAPNGLLSVRRFRSFVNCLR